MKFTEDRIKILIENLEQGSITDLTIANNPSLTDCAMSSLCTYLASPNGIVTIYNNAEGCNTPPQVADNCGMTMPCLPYGNYYFWNQAQIDSFQTDYSQAILVIPLTIRGM